MERIQSFEHLKQFYESVKYQTNMRLHPLNQAPDFVQLPEAYRKESQKRHVMVCADTGCAASHSIGIADKLEETIARYGLQDQVIVVKTGCFGLCSQGPIAVVHPERIMYTQLKAEHVEEIVRDHLRDGHYVEHLLLGAREGAPTTLYDNVDFFRNQVRIATRNCGVINPASLEEYISQKGYLALGKCIQEMTPDQVVETVKQSGLRGRGGAGFPTGLKWGFTAIEKEEQKYVCCNADEGDPGAFMDRSVLEGDPHSVLEAMAIAGYAIGANMGFIYIRAEYPSAIRRLLSSIEQAKEAGLLGANILGSSFSFDIELRLGAGAFVCGEETALIASVEGNRGEPRNKPPYPASKGIYGKPTVINNVETLANICPIILNGPEWFRSIGTERSPGTKVFALAGKVNNVGLIEVPMGTTLREIIYEIGGGIVDNKQLKAVQTGGPSGGCIPARYLDTPIDYESLQVIGTMMGSGGMIVLDETSCMVNIAKFYLEFTVEESCGKCTPCRFGNRYLLDIMNKITSGKGELEDLDRLFNLGETIKQASLCGLGQSSPNPVLSTLRYFRDEYVAHIQEKRCPAGVCTDLLQYHVVPELCIGCTICAKNCPVQCISGSLREPHVINQEACIKCGVCFTKCPKKAIIRK
jgi:NADH:ubiquinone oxidoreductase subunit F (NADH-binding)/(2Fe-2S) ferredoxin/Pyruvate/2-oxoacid:ferredoxin oxidoreductase delta subunit